jgi:hypothetical protein
VSSLGNQSPENRGIDWPAIVRTLLVQVLVLLALSGAFIGYLRWSSDTNWVEFISAGGLLAPDAKTHRQSSSPVQTVKGRCPRRA